MKINPMNMSGIQAYQRTQNQKQAQTKAADAKTDKVEISYQAKEMQETSQIDKERPDKVAALKQQVQSGNYKADPEKIAQGLYNYYAKK